MQTECIKDSETSVLTNDLENIFREIGSGFGYDKVSAKYVEFRDFKVRWTRSYSWIEFHVSDYLSEAPKEAVESLAKTLLSKINNVGNIPYTDEFCRYVMSKEFVKRWQPEYIKRSRNIAKTPIGDHMDLNRSYERLVDAGFVEKDEDIIFSWTKDCGLNRPSYSSMLMKTVVISRILDTDDIPEFVLDYIVLQELMNIKQGTINFCPKKGLTAEQAKVIIDSYPEKKEADRWIKEHCLQI